MKLLRRQILLAVVLLGSSMAMQMHAGQAAPQGKLQSWWRSTYFTDYLPAWIQSLIPRARIRQMFHGVALYYAKVRELGLSCTAAQMNQLVNEYNVWMQQYKDIINEETIISDFSIITGNPDSVLGLWKTILGICTAIDEKNVCVLSGITKIIKNLENMGAQVNRVEKIRLEPLSPFEDKFSM